MLSTCVYVGMPPKKYHVVFEGRGPGLNVISKLIGIVVIVTSPTNRTRTQKIISKLIVVISRMEKVPLNWGMVKVLEKNENAKEYES